MLRGGRWAKAEHGEPENDSLSLVTSRMLQHHVSAVGGLSSPAWRDQQADLE